MLSMIFTNINLFSMNRRILFSILVTIFVSLSAQAYDFQVGDLFYNITGNKTVEVTSIEKYSPSYSGMTSMTIPSSVSYDGTTYNVTSIGEYAFYFSVDLTSITIPNSVTSIGGSAFSFCTGLTSITIPNSVTSIGYYTFADCSSLATITIPNSVTSIGSSAFSGCDGLVSIVVETGNAFYDSRNNCNAIIETASNTLIAGCSTTIIPNTISNIGWGAFNGCFGLTSITIPNSVTSIGDHAFSFCTGLTSITIPNSVTSIGNSAFSGCDNLISITIPNSVISIGEFALSTPWYWNLPDGIVYINDVLYSYKGTMPQNSSRTIRQGTVSISPSAFINCSGLISITIPNSVTSIGSSAFWGCDNLSSITCYANTPPICDMSLGIDSVIVYVPCGSKHLYQADAVWGQVMSIECIEETDIESVESETSKQNTRKVIRNGQVIILRDGEEYSILGQKL